jgi:cell filamentation protein
LSKLEPQGSIAKLSEREANPREPREEIGNVVDWSKVDKEDYLLAMERSPIKTVEIKELLRQALTSEINNRVVYMKGIDASYSYEGYFIFKTEDMA